MKGKLGEKVIKIDYVLRSYSYYIWRDEKSSVVKDILKYEMIRFDDSLDRRVYIIKGF